MSEAESHAPRAPAGGGIEALFRPRSIAVVGASRRAGTIGAAIVFNLKESRFRGTIYPVNPKADEIFGLKSYPKVSAIGEAVDLAIIAVPAKFVEETVDDCARAGVKGVVIISAGFAESSPDGRETEQRILRRVREAGMRMVGPNCMGLLCTDPDAPMNGTFTPIWPPSGNIGILSQSGALGLAILDYVRNLNLGISSFISVGNKADVSANDLLEYWADDPQTDVIVLYLESFGNPRKFARIAPRVVRRKPIIAVKSGRTAAGKRAAQSHSASLASLDVAVDALFEEAGVIRTNTLVELFDVAALLACEPVPRGPRVGVVSNAGGPAILLADACEAAGLPLPQLDERTIATLRGLLPPEAGLANPIDLIGSDSPEVYTKAIAAVGNDPNVDSLVVMFIPPLVTTNPEHVAAGIAEGAGKIPAHKPVLCVFLSHRGTPRMLSFGPRGRIPSYSFPEDAALALSAAVRYGRWLARPQGSLLALDADAIARVRSVIDASLHATPAPHWLDTTSLATILDAVGIRFAAVVACDAADAAGVAERIGFPVVAKAVAPGLLHKSDIGGVILNLKTPDDVRAAVRTLDERVRAAGSRLEGVLIQQQVGGGIEALVGVTLDPTFGPLLVCGMGGVNVELLRDVSFRLIPVTDVDAAEMIGKLRSAPLLDGYRGGPKGDRDALVSLMMRISALVEAVPELCELDLNPVKVLPPGEGAVVVDGRLRIAPPDGNGRTGGSVKM